jgi:hypothetical protein
MMPMPITPEPTLPHRHKLDPWSPSLTPLGKVLCLSSLIFLLGVPARAINVIPLDQYSVTLQWNRSPSVAAVGYHLYYGTASGNYTSSKLLGNVTTNTVVGLASNVTYFFALKTYDAHGLESDFSNEISFAPGVPDLQIRAASDGHFILTVSGLINHTYQILATQTFTDWTVIGSVIISASGSQSFTDIDAASFPQRFYRTQLIP